MQIKPNKYRQARMDAGIAQNTAWAKLGLRGLGDLMDYENDFNKPSNEVLKRMAVLYDVSVEELRGTVL
jgi:hypothetical protein